jgi:hypothetical protein
MQDDNVGSSLSFQSTTAAEEELLRQFQCEGLREYVDRGTEELPWECGGLDSLIDGWREDESMGYQQPLLSEDDPKKVRAYPQLQ